MTRCKSNRKLHVPDTPDNWEELCQGCGECCFEKVISPAGRLVTTKIACRYLDVVTRQCNIYPKRFEIEPTCLKLTPELVSGATWLPVSCAYVKWLQDHLNH